MTCGTRAAGFSETCAVCGDRDVRFQWHTAGGTVDVPASDLPGLEDFAARYQVLVDRAEALGVELEPASGIDRAWLGSE